MAVGTIMPAVARELNGLDDYGWAFSAFMLSSLIGAIAAGQASDRGDTGRPAALGFVAFSLGLLVSGTAPAWDVLLLGRTLQGFGGGCLGAVAYVVLARGYPARLRPRMLALLSSAWIMPSLLGPAVAGQVAEHASWRLVFIGILAAMPVGAWMLLPIVSRLPAPSVALPTSGRVAVSVRLAAGTALILLAAGQEVPPLPWLLPVASTALVAVTGIVLAAPALTQLLPAGTLSARVGMPSAVALRALLAFGFFGSSALIPLGLSAERDLSPSLIGLSLTAGALAWVAGTWLQDRAEARSNRSVPHRAVRVAAGLVLIVSGASGVATVIIAPALPIEFATAAWAISGLGMGLAYPATTLTALGAAEPGQEGFASAALQVAETIGIAAGAGAAGALVALASHAERPIGDGLAWGFLLSITALAMGLIPALRLAPTLPWPAAWRRQPET
jgi:MFS family permease